VHRVGEDGARQEVILDAGTGVRLLGTELAERSNGELQLDLLLSHTHWDHIQGIPFFAPLFREGNQVRVWGAKQGDTDLPVILRQQMNPVVFPVPLDEIAADLQVEHVQPGRFEIDGFQVDAMRLRHPGNTLGYRLTPVDGGATVAYVPDNELGPGGDYEVPEDWREQFVRFLQGVDVLIHDAMFRDEDLEQFAGWGHSSPREAIAVAAEAGVKRLLLFHHRPDHDDDVMDRLVENAQRQADAVGVSVEAAVEGMLISL
jgi:ribonuclease BN (tRNA processing enzyme)